MLRVAGIMSGTSLDGIDVAIVDLDRNRLNTVAFTSHPYSTEIRSALLAVSNAHTHTAEISRLNFGLAELYAERLIATAWHAGIPLDSVQLIGCHGQTVYHEGTNTLQIGEAAVLVERTGIPCVSNFRSRDIAAGGQGAPLVPYFDYRMFRDRRRRRAALNIGGIANVTIIPPSGTPDDVVAFDTGPGNMVVDQLVSRYTEGREAFDRGGAIAQSGTPCHQLLQQLMADPYYGREPPKSAGREQYGHDFIARLESSGRAYPDLIATATLLTAHTIAQALDSATGDLIASGGGIHNAYLMAKLDELLPDMFITTTASFGIEPDAKEAIAFAVLAYETWHRRPSNLPRATGARHAVILGDITHASPRPSPLEY